MTSKLWQNQQILWGGAPVTTDWPQQWKRGVPLGKFEAANPPLRPNPAPFHPLPLPGFLLMLPILSLLFQLWCRIIISASISRRQNLWPISPETSAFTSSSSLSWLHHSSASLAREELEPYL